MADDVRAEEPAETGEVGAVLCVERVRMFDQHLRG
jgi:hypothetical protein